MKRLPTLSVATGCLMLILALAAPPAYAFKGGDGGGGGGGGRGGGGGGGGGRGGGGASISGGGRSGGISGGASIGGGGRSGGSFGGGRISGGGGGGRISGGAIGGGSIGGGRISGGSVNGGGRVSGGSIGGGGRGGSFSGGGSGASIGGSGRISGGSIGGSGRISGGSIGGSGRISGGAIGGGRMDGGSRIGGGVIGGGVIGGGSSSGSIPRGGSISGGSRGSAPATPRGPSILDRGAEVGRSSGGRGGSPATPRGPSILDRGAEVGRAGGSGRSGQFNPGSTATVPRRTDAGEPRSMTSSRGTTGRSGPSILDRGSEITRGSRSAGGGGGGRTLNDLTNSNRNEAGRLETGRGDPARGETGRLSGRGGGSLGDLRREPSLVGKFNSERVEQLRSERRGGAGGDTIAGRDLPRLDGARGGGRGGPSLDGLERDLRENPRGGSDRSPGGRGSGAAVEPRDFWNGVGKGLQSGLASVRQSTTMRRGAGGGSGGGRFLTADLATTRDRGAGGGGGRDRGDVQVNVAIGGGFNVVRGFPRFHGPALPFYAFGYGGGWNRGRSLFVGVRFNNFALAFGRFGRPGWAGSIGFGPGWYGRWNQPWYGWGSLGWRTRFWGFGWGYAPCSYYGWGFYDWNPCWRFSCWGSPFLNYGYGGWGGGGWGYGGGWGGSGFTGYGGYAPSYGVTTYVSNPQVVYDDSVVVAQAPAIAVQPAPGDAAPAAVSGRGLLDDWSAEDFAREGERQFKAGDYKKAARAFRHALVDDPENGLVVLLLAQSFFAEGKFEEAAGATQHAMQLLEEKNWGLVVANYKDLYVRSKDYTTQLRALEQARKDKPNEPALRFLLGYHYGYLGYPEEALLELNKLEELAPDDVLGMKLRDLMKAKVKKPETEEDAKPVPARTP